MGLPRLDSSLCMCLICINPPVITEVGVYDMKKVLLLTFALVFASSTLALAVRPGKDIVFEKGPMGKVTFSGDDHSTFKCAECHNPAMFPKKKRGTSSIKMAFLHKGELCGKCHDGVIAFRSMKNCYRCHIE
jgi:c(7)-type cytochrome triheme protein